MITITLPIWLSWIVSVCVALFSLGLGVVGIVFGVFIILDLPSMREYQLWRIEKDRE